MVPVFVLETTCWAFGAGAGERGRGRMGRDLREESGGGTGTVMRFGMICLSQAGHQASS